MERPVVDATEFWSGAEAVAATASATSCEWYEQGLLRHAVLCAGSVSLAHVVGAGAGHELATLRELAPIATIHTWDPASPMVALCRERADADGLGIDVGEGRMADLGATDGPAKLVVAFGAVLGCITPESERLESLRAVHDTLAPGGVMVMWVQQQHGRPDWAAWFAARDLTVARLRSHEQPGDRRSSPRGRATLHHHFTQRELRRLLDATGFDIVELTSLRRMLRAEGTRLPTTSPNPLVCLASRRSGQGIERD